MKLPLGEDEYCLGVTVSSGTLSRLERFKRVLTPEGCSGELRGRGRKGGVVVAQPLSRSVLKPLKNTFRGSVERPQRVRTPNDVHNAWFKANAKETQAQYTPSHTLVKKPLTGLIMYETLDLQDFPSLRRTHVSSYSEEVRDVAELCDKHAEGITLSKEDRAFQRLVGSTRAKYKLGKWSPNASTVWDVCRERDVEQETLRVQTEVQRLSLPC